MYRHDMEIVKTSIPRSKSGRRLQSPKSGLNLQILAVPNGGHRRIKNLHPGYKFDWAPPNSLAKPSDSSHLIARIALHIDALATLDLDHARHLLHHLLLCPFVIAIVVDVALNHGDVWTVRGKAPKQRPGLGTTEAVVAVEEFNEVRH